MEIESRAFPTVASVQVPTQILRATRIIKKSQTNTVLPKRLSHLEVACGLVAIASTLGDLAGYNSSHL